MILPRLINRITHNAQLFGSQFPTVGDSKTYHLTENDHWLAGFWTGLLWLAYAASGREELRLKAEALLLLFEDRLDRQIHITHDLGFLFTLSARAQWQLTGDAHARDLAIRAALQLADRYRPLGAYIQAWGPVGDPQDGGRMIIDTMMNLPLLFWASAELNQPRLHEIAEKHAHTTARFLLRPDVSSYHTFLFDPETGQPLRPQTHQGYADNSLWARGQGWVIYGFTVASEWCQSADFRDLAVRAAERFMAELPADHIPRWDLRLPPDAPSYPDTSASAIAAAGMFRLAKLVEPDRAAVLRSNAQMLLDALLDQMLETDSEGQGLLRGSTYHAHKGWGVDAYFICGDYFFLEALLHDSAPDFWGRSNLT
ncbi:MAG TPA: glycoside hydrolase family 88 protein [Aggregatilineaceae bacterium]|nr:glycoside hydrolase family 88 protein [Aggregatilineaceae bacterium]